MKTGILASYREKFLLLKEKCLTDQEFILYDYCVHQADFDENHKGKFGTFEKTNIELAKGLGWSDDKVGRNINKLILRGLLKKNDRRTIEIIDYYRFLPTHAFDRTKEGKELAYLREKIAKMRSQVANSREETAKLRNPTTNLVTNNTPISDIGSYKVNSFVTRSFADYKRIKEEGGYTTLTEEDMKWIDANITETPNF